MQHPETHIVKPEDERPARKDGTCYYCRTAIGSHHKPGCVIRTRTVVCEFTVTLTRSVPEDWDQYMIEFHMNDSSWCASNLIHEMESLDMERCLCGNIEGKFVREATADDEDRYGVTRR